MSRIIKLPLANAVPGMPGATAPALANNHSFKEHALALALLALALFIPLGTSSAYLQDALILVLLWASLASAWNIAGGFAGQLSLGHAAFFGLGAYTSTLLKLHLDISPWIGMIAGGALVLLVSAFMAFAATRLRGPYFGLVTVALAAVLQIVAARWREVTKGNEGLPIAFQPGFENFIFSSKLPWTFIILAYVVLIYLFCVWLSKSRVGYQLAAMREDEPAAAALGVNCRLLKIVFIAISGFLTALGGTFYAQYIGFVDPGYVFSFDLSIKFALMCIIGVMGTPLGPILGALLITTLEIYLRATWGGERSGLYLIVYGTLLILVLRFMPEGLIIGVPKLIRRWRGKNAA
ncbi:MAG: transporter permease [Paucimonas sp.]|nr:transporter permease [Paucimonas sp.]